MARKRKKAKRESEDEVNNINGLSNRCHPVEEPQALAQARHEQPEAAEKTQRKTKTEAGKGKGKGVQRKRRRRRETDGVKGIHSHCWDAFYKVLGLIETLHRALVYFVVEVLIGLAEEFVKHTCRETIRQILRFTNSIPAFFISLVDDKFFWRKMRREYSTHSGAQGAWRQFWSNTQRISSFNALFDLHQEPQQQKQEEEEEEEEEEEQKRRDARHPKSDKGKGKGTRDSAGQTGLLYSKSTPRRGKHDRRDTRREGGRKVKLQGVYLKAQEFLKNLWLVQIIAGLFSWLKNMLVMPDKQSNPESQSMLFPKLDVDVSGFLEDVSVSLSVCVTLYFSFVKGLFRVLLLDFSNWRLGSKFNQSGSSRPSAPSRRGGRHRGSEGPERVFEQEEGKEDDDNEDENEHENAGEEGLSLPKLKRSPSLIVLKASMKKIRRDEWSIENTITDAGYPFEKYSVETIDGYKLDLYRIPRPESSRVVMFQHGMMDSAYGWVLKGDESAVAFAAYDRGFDVFLANFRGATPRKCKTSASKKFWKYSINEIGMYDITASVGKIHCLKQEVMGEEGEEKGEGENPYKLCVVGHSLGGAALLIYISTALRLCKEHHVHRMILLSPAGVHHYHLPLLARILCMVDSVLGFWLKRLNFGMTVYGSVLRVGAQKVAVDVSSLPGLQGLFNIFCRILVGGDKSFGGEIMAPYMTPYIQSMPGICWGIVRHGHQLVKARRFVLYDYGSEVENLKHYGRATPPRVLDELSTLNHVPIDFVAGKKDGVVPAENVYELFTELKKRDLPVSYREFNLGHLHFTFDPSEEFTNYLLSRCCI